MYVSIFVVVVVVLASLLPIITLLTLRHTLLLLQSDGGFDHHDNMKNNLRPKLRVVNANLRKLVNQLKADNLWDSVVIVQTSEFARTVSHCWSGV